MLSRLRRNRSKSKDEEENGGKIDDERILPPQNHGYDTDIRRTQQPAVNHFTFY